MKKPLVIIILILLIVPLFATTFRIESYDFVITGRTRENAVRRLVAQDEGVTFESKRELEKAIENKRQRLLSLRLFKDVKATWSTVSTTPDHVDISVKFTIIGSISLTVMPGINYDTNTGYNLQAMYIDSNFFGNTKETAFFMNLYDKDMNFANYYANYHVHSGFYIGNWDHHINADFYFFKTDPSESYFSFSFNSRKINTETGSLSNSFNVALYPFSHKRTGFRIMETVGDSVEFSFDKDVTWSMSYSANISEDLDDTMSNLASVGIKYALDKLLPFRMYAGFMFNVGWTNQEVPDYGTEFNAGSEDSDIRWEGDFRYGWSYRIEAMAADKGRLHTIGHAEYYRLLGERLNFTTRVLFKSCNYVEENENGRFGSYLRGIRDDNQYLTDKDFLTAGILNLNLYWLGLHFDLVNFFAGGFLDIGYIAPYGPLGGIGFELIMIIAEWPGVPFRISYGHSLTNPTEYEITFNSAYLF